MPPPCSRDSGVDSPRPVLRFEQEGASPRADADRHGRPPPPKPSDPGPPSCHSPLTDGRSRSCADTRRLRRFVLPGVSSRGQLPPTPGAGEDEEREDLDGGETTGSSRRSRRPAPTSSRRRLFSPGRYPRSSGGFDVLPQRPTAAHGDLLRLFPPNQHPAERCPRREQRRQVRIHYKPFHQDTGPPMVSLTERHHDLRDGLHLGNRGRSLHKAPLNDAETRTDPAPSVLAPPRQSAT